MRYRTIGKTGLKASILAYGGSGLGGAFGEIPAEAGVRSVHASLDAGINLFDTSPFYGNTLAETALGKALKGVLRDRYLLATKCGRYAGSDFSAKRVLAGLDESLQRLDVEHVDFLHAHDIEFADLNQVIEETLPAMRKARDAGKARFIGITGYPLKVLRHVVERTEVDVVLSYCNYTLQNTRLDDWIPELRDRQIGIMNAAPVAMGLLTNQGTPAWHPASETIQQACAAAAAHCRSRGSDIGKLAVQFATQNANVCTTIVGGADTDKMMDNVRWIDEPIDEQLLAEVREILKPVQNETWNSGGLPENQ